jgi:hypothetical protein
MTAIEMVNVLRKVKWNRPGPPDRASTAQKTQ